MNCPKCGFEVSETAVDCPSCGIVIAKAAEAMDRAMLRRRMTANAPVVVQEKKSPLGIIVIVGILLVCAFGAYQWYTDDTESSLDKLAAEVKNADPDHRPALDNERSARWNRRFLIRIGILVAVALAGYQSWKQSMSP